MRSKSLLLTSFLAVMALTVNAQEWQDVTSQYITNATFDSDFDYDKSATAGDVQPNDIKEVKGWTKHTQTTKGVTGVYQYGTQKTVMGETIPSAGADGNKDGGCLVLRPNTKTPASYCLHLTDDNKLPIGTYKIEIAMWHLGSTDLRIQNRWISTMPVEEDAPAHQPVYDSNEGSKCNIETGKWVTETIEFTLDEASKGDIYLAVAGPSSFGKAASGIAIDYVKILSKSTAAGINDIHTNKKDEKAYNIMGQPVGKDARGLLIVGGKKVVRK